MKNIRVFVSENFQFLEVKFSIYLNRRVFVMHLNCIDVDAIQMGTHNICLYKENQKQKHCISIIDKSFPDLFF